MSQNKIPVTLPTIEKILQRISVAEKTQQKEIRITIQEARDLSMELSAMTARMAKTVHEIHEMLQEIRQNTTEIEVKVDGGGFR
jgi:predicted  nucleic acid-binding Zn-ribbon protein